MDDVFLRLEEELRAGRPAALLTVVESHGATPRGAGSRQLVLTSGDTVGTIGGGIGEYKACEAARQALQDGVSTLLAYDLSPGAAADMGAVCGGTVTVFCQYIGPDAAACIGAMVESGRNRRPYLLLCDMTEPERWAMAVSGPETIYCGDGRHAADLQRFLQDCGENPTYKPQLIQYSGRLLYAESFFPSSRAFIFGGGHVACALVPVLARVGFSCVVVDDREDFANAERFPDAESVVVADLEHLPDFHIGEDDYVCIMTRGHVGDYVVERQILPLRPQYIGVIGSRNKLHFVREKLLADGFAAEEIDNTYGPIGLPISAATPEEIAVSIAAELISVRARREGREKADAKKWRAADVPHIRLP